MHLLAFLFTLLVAAAPAERPALIVEAPGSPVRLVRATILSGAEGPPILVYAASNLTEDVLDQFTVIAYTFDESGTLKARQTAPGRRTLEPHETKYSTLVVDGAPFGPTDVMVVGVNQVQREGSDTWWRAELQDAAVATQKKAP